MSTPLRPWINLLMPLGLMLAPGGTTFANAPEADAAKSERMDPRVPILLPENQNLFEEKTLPRDDSRRNTFKPQDSPERIPTGLRIFTVRLNPKEKIEFRLKAEDLGYMRMIFSVSRDFLDMKGPIRIANLALPESRERSIKIQNATSNPQEVLLCISGQASYSYKLEWTRIPLS